MKFLQDNAPLGLSHRGSKLVLIYLSIMSLFEVLNFHKLCSQLVTRHTNILCHKTERFKTWTHFSFSVFSIKKGPWLMEISLFPIEGIRFRSNGLLRSERNELRHRPEQIGWGASGSHDPTIILISKTYACVKQQKKLILMGNCKVSNRRRLVLKLLQMFLSVHGC